MQGKEYLLQLIETNFIRVIKERDEWQKELINFLQHTKRPIYIFGAGSAGLPASFRLQALNIVVRGFLDNDEKKIGTKILGLPVYKPTDIEKETIVFIHMAKAPEAYRQLEQLGIETIIDGASFDLQTKIDDFTAKDLTKMYDMAGKVYDLLEDTESKEILIAHFEEFLLFQKGFAKPRYYEKFYRPLQYFLEDIFTFTQDETIVDCGAFTGDTLEDFLKLKIPFFRYFAYELSKKNAQILKQKANEFNKKARKEKIIVYPLGVGDKDEIVYYTSDNDDNKIDAHAHIEGRIVNLSSHLQKEKITFLKMDIEGAELKALEGAKELILKGKPKLAISVYHHISDFFTIPLYLHRLVPEYKFFLRQHTIFHMDTVLYAVKN